MRTVAGAEPAIVVTGLTDGHATQVSADTDHNEPLGVLYSLLVSLGVTKDGDVDGFGLLDLGFRAVTHENGLSTPLNHNVLGNGNVGKVNLDLGQGKHILGGAHGGQKVLHSVSGSDSGDQTERANHEVAEVTVAIGVTVGLQVLAEVGNLVRRGTSNGLAVLGAICAESRRKTSGRALDFLQSFQHLALGRGGVKRRVWCGLWYG